MAPHTHRHLKLAERETATSFFSRSAASHWVDAATMAVDKGTSFQGIIDGLPKAFESLAEHEVRIPEEILDWSPSKTTARRKFRGHLFPSKVMHATEVRGCPKCLREDAAKTDMPAHWAMAMRGHWLVPHVSLCLKHESKLLPLWCEPRSYTRYDSAVHLARIAEDVLSGSLDGDYRPPTAFDLWLDDRLLGNTPGNWLDGMPLHATATFCFLLGNTLVQHHEIAPTNRNMGNRWFLYQKGYEVAQEGEQAIRDALRTHQMTAFPARFGPKQTFPLLYERLGFQYRGNPDFAPFREILRTHMQETWAIGEGEELMGEPVTKRRLHSIVTACRATRVDRKRLRKTLSDAGLVPDQGKGLPDAWEVFDADAAKPILEELTALVPANAFASLIGASRSQFEILVEDRLLELLLTGTNVKAVWLPADGQAFVESLLTTAVPLWNAPSNWIHISRSAQKLKIRPGEIISAIRDGRLIRTGNHTGFKGYAAVFVDHTEVSRVLGKVSPPGQSIEVFAKSVGVNQPSRMRRLVLNGHTPATKMKNPGTNAEQFFFTSENIDAFHRKFLTPRTMAKELGRSWQSVSAEVRAKAIEPFSPDGGDYGNLYLREKVLPPNS